MSRGCMMKRLYSMATPYVQIGGWVVVAVPAVFSMYSLVNDARAFSTRQDAADSNIATLKEAQAVQAGDIKSINEKLNLIIQFTRPRK